MRGFVYIFSVLFIVNLAVVAQEVAPQASVPPAQPEFIKGKERYFFQLGALNTTRTDTIRNMYQNTNAAFAIGIESVVSRYASLRFGLGYSSWRVNTARVAELYADSVTKGKLFEVSPSHNMQLISVNPDLKLFYPGSTRQVSAYAMLGVTGYFTFQKAIVKMTEVSNVDQSLAPLASLNVNFGLGGEYHINDLLMVYLEAKYGREILNFAVPNSSKWINTSLALGLAVKFGNE